MSDRIEEVKLEIEALEAIEGLSSEEYKQLKSLRAELKKLEEEFSKRDVYAALAVRPLNRRDLQIMRTLIKDYPGFSNLEEGDRIDRMVLVLTSVCELGGVTPGLLQEIMGHLNYKMQIDILGHFQNSTWLNRAGEKRPRYVNNFADAFKLDPGLSIKLSSEGKDEEAPVVRKPVASPSGVSEDGFSLMTRSPGKSEESVQSLKHEKKGESEAPSSADPSPSSPLGRLFSKIFKKP